MAVDWKTNRDLMQKLYILFYGRPADPEGVKFWASLLLFNFIITGSFYYANHRLCSDD